MIFRIGWRHNTNQVEKTIKIYILIITLRTLQTHTMATKKTDPKKTTTKTTKKIPPKQIEDINLDDYNDEDISRIKQKINYISQEWYDRLVNELEDIKNNKTPAVLWRIKEAIAFGDLRENSEYEAALSEKELLENRIDQLNSLLEWAVITETDLENTSKKDRTIKYGSNVKFKMIDFDKKNTSDEEWMDKLNNREFNITVVSSGEITNSDDVATRLSFDSPIGQALEGKKIGDTARVRSPLGIYIIEVLDIE